MWLVRQYGRQQRATIGTYAAGARAFLRFLARRGLLPTGVTFEQIAENLRAAMGRTSYKAPRVDRRVPLIVTHVRALDERGGHARASGWSGCAIGRSSRRSSARACGGPRWRR